MCVCGVCFVRLGIETCWLVVYLLCAWCVRDAIQHATGLSTTTTATNSLGCAFNFSFFYTHSCCFNRFVRLFCFRIPLHLFISFSPCLFAIVLVFVLCRFHLLVVYCCCVMCRLVLCCFVSMLFTLFCTHTHTHIQ